MKWKPYDPTWLAELVKKQRADEPWLPDALAKCTLYSEDSRAYYRFIDSSSPAWKFERNIVLHHKREGEIVLDILQGDRVGGVEFLKRL